MQHADILVVACELLAATCMWDLVPQPGIEPRPPALGARSLTHWTTREVSVCLLFLKIICREFFLKRMVDCEVDNTFYFVFCFSGKFSHPSFFQQSARLTWSWTISLFNLSLLQIRSYLLFPFVPIPNMLCYHQGADLIIIWKGVGLPI